MRNWVKGGLIGFVVGVLLMFMVSFFMPVTYMSCPELNLEGVGCFSSQRFDKIVVFTFLLNNINKIILYFIIPLVGLGALIGFVVGKYKSKGVK